MGTLTEFTSVSRRKYPKSAMCHMSHNTFSYYGLNVHKNFLEPNTFHYKDSGFDDEDHYNELNSFIVDILCEIILIAECAAVFVVKKDGTEIVYQIDHDFHFDEDANFVEDEPVITVTRIMDDYSHKAFGTFDAENVYDLYGLLIETGDDVYRVVDS